MMMQMLKIAALLVVVLALILPFGCSDEEELPSSPPFEGVENNLVFTRSDDSEIEFGDYTLVWVGYWESMVKVDALHIIVSDSWPPSSPVRYWRLKAVIDDIVIGEKLEFPINFVWNDPREVMLFAYDEPNELSSQEEESRGWITFHKLRTSGSGEVHFTIDAVLGSEYHDGDSCSVQGTFRASIGSVPL